MAPVRPPTVRGSSSRASFLGDLEQAGRSETNLHAHRSSASISRSSTPNTSSTSPNVLRKKQKANQAQAQPSWTSNPQTLGDTTSPDRPTRQDTELPFPLSSSRSNGSSSSASSNSRTVDRQTRDAAATAAGIALASNLPPPPRLTGDGAVERFSRVSSSTSLSRLGTPRTVRDLGQDYTRYFNPFASRSNSATDLSTPLPRYNSATNLVPAQSPSKRNSDPFVDEKRLSDPHEGNGAAAGTAAVTTAALPQAETRNAFIDAADPEKAFFFPYLDDRLGAPGAESAGYRFPMYWDEKEEDDDMHMPMVDDNIRLKPKLNDRFSRENIISTLGMLFMLLGLLTLFIVLPVVSSTGVNLISYANETPLDQMYSPSSSQAEPWATVNNRTYPLMSNIRTGLIDPDTPDSAMTRTAVDGSTLNLVFSDEFNAPNRTFYQGDDPFFYGFDGWYGATQDLEWYDPDAINTNDGTLSLQLDAFPNHNLAFRSGMLHSWNQACFKGGVFEVSVSLPGPGGIHGLWPGVWTMGNLGRPGYLATTDGMWPYTYNECDAGITPNQSMNDGTSMLPGQRLTSCGCAGSDHPTPGTGRGAPEIDIIEVSGDWGGKGIAVATQSFQVAPFDIWWYPNYEFMETPNYGTSFVNTYTGGPYQQAVSTTSMLNNSWYDGEMYQKYAYEYTPGDSDESGIAWYVGDEITMRFDARALGPNGNIGQRLISEEPMTMIMNLGISNSWVDINWAALKFPTIMRIDYVRWYQAPGSESVTCDPPGYETTEYIANHPEAYNNPNYTHWTDIPGYTLPKNTLMHTC